MGIRTYIERMEKEEIRRAIIIVQVGVTPYAKQVLQAMQPKMILEQFREVELLVNITKHVLVPRHMLLSSPEKQELLVRYKLKDTQLPRIQLNDPIARFY